MAEIIQIVHHPRKVEVVDMVYGDNTIFNWAIRDNLREAIEEYERFSVSNENLGGETKPGEKKSCSIKWRDYTGGPLLADTAYEGECFNFGSYIKMVTYGDVAIMNNPGIYDSLHRTWKAMDAFHENQRWEPFARYKKEDQIDLGNEFFGWDPKPGVQKKIIIEIATKEPQEEGDQSCFLEGDKWPFGSNQVDEDSDSAADPESSG